MTPPNENPYAAPRADLSAPDSALPARRSGPGRPPAERWPLFAAGAWVVVVTFMPIANDVPHTPLPRALFWAITAGNLAALVTLLYPRRKSCGVSLLCGLLALWSLVLTGVLWMWNYD